jgi:serine/threonine-protein kinase
MAPELADGARFTTPAADVFSFGVLAYEILTRAMPFSEPVAVVRLAQRALPPMRPLHLLCPQLAPEVVSLIEQCLSADPEQRPTAEQLVSVLSVAGPGSTMGAASS